MIQAFDLTRRFGPKTAVDGISFAAGNGEILGILGPNGAGKTTTLRMITGFLPPDAGRVTLGEPGLDLATHPLEARRQLGYLPENVALYPEMRVTEYLAYRARLCGIERGRVKTAIGEALERCLLVDVQRQVIGTLSKGYRQRVGLAQAILHRPQVLVLDEPTVGLDPKQILAIRELIRDLGRERTLLLSSHILPEVELLCHRVLIIDRGKIVGEGTPESLRADRHGQRVVRVLLKGPADGAPEALAGLPGVTAVTPHPAGGGALRITGAPGADPRETIFRAVVAHGWVLLGMEEERASLEDIFIRLTTHDAAQEAADPGEEVAA